MFLLVLRFVGVVVSLSLCCLLLKIWLLFHDPKKPLLGLRKFLVNWTIYFSIRLLGICFLTWYRQKWLTHKDVDYSEYLGTNEPQPVGASLGAQMKEFYSLATEISSATIRQKTGSGFVTMGSQLLLEG